MAAEDTLNDRYVLEGRTLGLGGMGQVRLARDARLGRIVVVKLIRLWGDGSDEERVRRFIREARLTAQLDHPGVPTVYDMGRHNDRPYLVMQWIDGITIADLHIEHTPLPIGWAAAIGAQVCSVLMAAHDAGLIHRDIKPDNLMLDRRGGVKVLDFGVAGVFGRSDVSRITRTGEGVGTLPYMAPEQLISGESTPQIDLYGLGCTLYELLTGAPPFVADNDLVLMNMHMGTSPAPLREQRPDIPRHLEDLVLAMLEKQPADRPPGAAAVYEGLIALISDLPNLPGVLAPRTDPVRAYLALGGRMPAVAQVPRQLIDRDRIASARAQAHDLIEMAQFDQAAQVLSAIVEFAAHESCGLDDDILDLRETYAMVLHDAGRLRAAAREQRSLANDLSHRYGADDGRVLACRLRAARAHVGLKELARARNQFSDLLDDYLRIYGPQHESVHDLREEIEALDAPQVTPARSSGLR